ncbi:MAG: hypothetical protein ACOC3Z_00925 [Nanoarchaeota archaeon]
MIENNNLGYENLIKLETSSDTILIPFYNENISSFEENYFTLPDLLKDNEIKNYIETITSSETDIFVNFTNGFSKIGKLYFDKEINASRSNVKKFTINNLDYINAYYKKQFSSIDSFNSEFLGLNKLKDIINVPNIVSVDKNNLSISLEEIKAPLFFDYLENNGVDDNIFYKLVEEIALIGLEGKKRNVFSYISKMDFENISDWFDNNLFKEINHTGDFDDLKQICIDNLCSVSDEDMFYSKDVHSKNVLFDGNNFYHIDFEFSKFVAFQFELANALEYEGMNLNNDLKEKLLTHFVSYVNQDEKIIESKDKFIEQYYNVAFSKNIKSAITRAKWAKDYVDSFFSSSSKTDLDNYHKFMSYKNVHITQALNNDIAFKTSSTNDQIMDLNECFLKKKYLHVLF